MNAGNVIKNQMNNYTVLCIGWLIGQFAYNCIKTHELQKEHAELSYRDAAVVVFWKGIGTTLIAFAGLLIALFIMPEFFKNVMTNDDVNKSPGWAQTIVNWLRASSVAFGLLAQYIVVWLAGGLKKTTERFINNKTGN